MLYDPVAGGGITMRGIRLTDEASISHDPEAPTKKAPQKRSGTKKAPKDAPLPTSND